MAEETYAKADLHKAEIITENGGASHGWNQSLTRMRVPGGWLYVGQVNSVRGVALAQTFVPDPLPEIKITGPEDTPRYYTGPEDGLRLYGGETPL